MTESRSKSLTADTEDMGLTGRARRFTGENDMLLSLPSSSMCSSRPAGKENRGDAQLEGWDRLRIEEATGEEPGG